MSFRFSLAAGEVGRHDRGITVPGERPEGDADSDPAKAGAEHDGAVPRACEPLVHDPLSGDIPDDIYLGEAVGVATNSKGNIFVYTRTGNPARRSAHARTFARTAARGCSSSIPSGKFVREIGQGLYGFVFAHTVRVDPPGQHLGRRRRLEHGHQVRSRKAAC